MIQRGRIDFGVGQTGVGIPVPSPRDFLVEEGEDPVRLRVAATEMIKLCDWCDVG